MQLYANIYNPFQALARPGTIYPGGICSIYLIRKQDIETWPAIDPETGGITDDIGLVSGASMYLLQATDSGKSMSEEVKQSPAGPYTEVKVNAKLPGNNSSNFYSLQNALYQQFAVLIKDRNGERRLIGNADSCPRIIWSYNTGDAESSRIYTLQLNWSTQLRPPVYQGILDNLSDIPGGSSSAVSVISLVTRFKVGESGSPMAAGDTVFTSSSIANRYVKVFQDGMKVTEFVAGITVENYIQKTLSGSTITWMNGGPAAGSIIEIYAFS